MTTDDSLQQGPFEAPGLSNQYSMALPEFESLQRPAGGGWVPELTAPLEGSAVAIDCSGLVRDGSW